MKTALRTTVFALRILTIPAAAATVDAPPPLQASLDAASSPSENADAIASAGRSQVELSNPCSGRPQTILYGALFTDREHHQPRRDTAVDGRGGSFTAFGAGTGDDERPDRFQQPAYAISAPVVPQKTAGD